ncbi:hypothetical protein RFI_01719 [Reticulomyxa filosa]|uniref:Uncharacterized protein n=1 Tax=Reticulomyxa filosa TaxID=46433 RepID=X6PB38_RETFI|nr:hypothetical protein RFI_01719 [Reticulomyxa filosa]|eukprot:ETO35343.1 hypothetical protein RFI_01719 [Reticulomyxa filosa]
MLKTCAYILIEAILDSLNVIVIILVLDQNPTTLEETETALDKEQNCFEEYTEFRYNCIKTQTNQVVEVIGTTITIVLNKNIYKKHNKVSYLKCQKNNNLQHQNQKSNDARLIDEPDYMEIKLHNKEILTIHTIADTGASYVQALVIVHAGGSIILQKKFDINIHNANKKHTKEFKVFMLYQTFN